MQESFWDRFRGLCMERNISPNKTAKELGISKRTITLWRGGVWPHGVLLQRLSDFFGIPAAVLIDTPQYRMLGDPKDKMILTDQELQFIRAYRRNPALQRGIDKLLDVPSETDVDS